MKLHMANAVVSVYWDRTYCGRTYNFYSGHVTYDPRKTTCGTCWRAQGQDWCLECGKQWCAWDEEDVCRCSDKLNKINATAK